VGNNKSTTTKNAGKLLAILIAVRVRRYDARLIAQWITSRASLKATGCSHRAAPAAAMVDKFVKQHKTLTKN
jgi:hypothetical protein